jgi:DNA polymerase-1
MVEPLTLLVDGDFLMYRSHFAFRELSYGGRSTGASYGMLSQLLWLMDRYQTNDIIFCWDSRTKKRKKLYPAYKANRIRQQTPEQQAEFEGLQKERARMRTRYLPCIGFHNNFCYTGYEADDILAVLAWALSQQERDQIIVTADQDLYQCIGPHTSWLCPSRARDNHVNLRTFYQEYQLEPFQWALVKAISGCKTDNIAGVPGVGEITAVKYLRKQLREESVAWQNIHRCWQSIVCRNWALVKLPFKGTPVPTLRANNLRQDGWDAVTGQMGMKSLRFKQIRTGE